MTKEKKPSVKVDWVKLIGLTVGLIIGGVLAIKII